MNNTTTLQHWGIKGMKWGVRRYQNKDGTLTALGRKREREMSDKLKSANKELKELKKENATLKKNVSANSRKVSEMSDEELVYRINRLGLEKRYSEIYSQVHPTKPNPGKEFANKMFKESVVPALVNVGKSSIEKGLKKAFGLEDKPDPNKQLELASRKLDYASKQLDYENKKLDLNNKKNPKEDKLADELKRIENEYKIADYKNKIASLGKDKTSVSDIAKELNNMSDEDKKSLESASKIQEWINKLNKN